MEQTNDTQMQHIKGAIEALLFVNERPITFDQIKKVFDTVKPSEVKEAITQLQDEYQARNAGILLMEIAGGYQMLSNKMYASYIRNFYKTKHKEKLSKPALESLAIIAYKQPVTRVEIEAIRGVNSDGVVNHLLEKELVKIIGRKDVPGKPYLYGTTKIFMEYFGLKSLDDLPDLEEFPNLQPDYENTKLDTDGSGEDSGEDGEQTEGQQEAGEEDGPAESVEESSQEEPEQEIGEDNEEVIQEEKAER